jgi:hypothetical protein
MGTVPIKKNHQRNQDFLFLIDTSMEVYNRQIKNFMEVKQISIKIKA